MYSKSNATFKGWYLLKKKKDTAYYFGYTANGKLGWLTLPNLVAYYVFSDCEKISTTRCKVLSSGESLHFRGIYTQKNINDSVSSKWKGYEHYTSITNTKTRNYYISHGGTYDGTKYDTKTDSITGIRYVLKNNRRYYCAAIGTYYGSVGSTHVVVLDNHVGVHIIVADSKGTDAVCKTINGKKYSLYHNKTDVKQHEYVEFVVDKNVIKNNKVSTYGCLNTPFKIYNANVIGMT